MLQLSKLFDAYIKCLKRAIYKSILSEVLGDRYYDSKPLIHGFL